MTRILALAASLAVALGLMAYAGTPTASAEPTGSKTAASTPVLPRAKQCLAVVKQPRTRQVNLCASMRRGTGILTGRVFPKYKRKLAILERAACAKGCTWRTVKRDRTTKRGKFRFTVRAEGHYRVKARRGQGFKKSYSDGSFHLVRY